MPAEQKEVFPKIEKFNLIKASSNIKETVSSLKEVKTLICLKAYKIKHACQQTFLKYGLFLKRLLFSQEISTIEDFKRLCKHTKTQKSFIY